MTVTARLTAAALTVAAGLAVSATAAGCGGAERPADPATVRAGAQVFQQAGCGTCHTLAAAADARAQIGPDLDELEPDADTVVRQVRRGGGGMPAYADRLSEQDISEVAAYVAEMAGGRR